MKKIKDLLNSVENTITNAEVKNADLKPVLTPEVSKEVLMKNKNEPKLVDDTNKSR